MGAYSYKPVADDNTTIDGVASQGASDPKLLDNINRYQSAALANFVRDLGGANTIGGTGDAITITVADLTAPTAYFDGMVVGYRAVSSNTGAATVNVNALGTKKIRKASNGAEVALTAGDMAAPGHYLLIYRAAWDSAAGAFQLMNPAVAGGSPVGAVIDYAGVTEPQGWLFCYGQAISRTTYAALFTAISTTYGSGDGSTTFNVPDLRGRVVAGQDDMGGSSANRLTSPLNGDTLGAAGGSESHTLTSAEMPVHSHGVNDPGHSHGVTSSGSPTQFQGPGGGWGGNVAGGSTGAAATGISIQNAGSGGAHNNVQPTFILNKIIYAGV